MVSDLVLDLVKICAVGSVAEVVLPWGLLELSNRFIFDIPPWSLWLVFGGPPALACLTFAIDLMVRVVRRNTARGRRIP